MINENNKKVLKYLMQLKVMKWRERKITITCHIGFYRPIGIFISPLFIKFNIKANTISFLRFFYF